MERYEILGMRPADILVPNKDTDLRKWCTVACDQYTSDRQYWEDVDKYVADSPSTLRIIYPECYLGDDDKEERIRNIDSTMEMYLDRGIFDEYRDCFILVRRETVNSVRWGLMVALDLEKYSYAPDSLSLIRATEGTILDRIPPRKQIRRNAPLELPHIMVLIDDKGKTVIEPLKDMNLDVIYETELMQGGGKITGYLVNDTDPVMDAIQGLYDRLDPSNPLLFAMGDGNHSLATAKSCYEDLKKEIGEKKALSSRARYALVELENIHDPGLEFEPIHRVFFNADITDFECTLSEFCDSYERTDMPTVEDMVREADKGVQSFGLCMNGRYYVYRVNNPKAALAAGTLQLVIDDMTTKEKCGIDYIHGVDETVKLGCEEGNIGIILPSVSKDTFFDSIIRDRAFPRKTFSMGEASEKRFYMEARRIR